MTKYILDFQGTATKEQIHAHLAETLPLPQHYGKNLDALYDCLMEISQPTCIGIYNVDISNGYMQSLVEMMQDIESENPNISILFGQQWLNKQ